MEHAWLALEAKLSAFGDLDSTAGRAWIALAVLAAIFITVRVLQAIAARRIDRPDVRYGVRKGLTFAAYAFSVVAVMFVFRDDLSGFGVALGVFGAGVAFALQEVITSVAGWFAISFAGFYKPGDRVQLGGIKGDVIDIGVLRTTIMEMGEWVDADLYNGRVVRVANSFVFKEPVYNYSGDFPFLWDEMMFPLKYGTDWQEAKALLMNVAHEVVDEFTAQAETAWQDALRKYRLEETSVEPVVTLRITDNWIEFRLRYVVDYRRRRTTQDRIATRFLEEVDRSEGRVGIASQTIHLVDGSVGRPLSVGREDSGVQSQAGNLPTRGE